MSLWIRVAALLLAAGLTLTPPTAGAASLSIDLAPVAGNPAKPEMGDHLTFHSVIRNDGTTLVDGLIAWLSLVQVDKGQERPVGLEDWSAEKAVSAAELKPGAALETDWSMRLIQAGHYRVVVSAASRHASALTASPFADFFVRRKPVVESRRVLPIALGMPILLLATIGWHRWRSVGHRVGAG